MPFFLFRPPYTVDWKAQYGDPPSVVNADVSKARGELDFQLVTPQPTPLSFVTATYSVPGPDRRNGGWVRMGVGQMVDPPPGSVMTINASLDLAMSWAIVVMAGMPPHVPPARGHTDAFVGLYVQEYMNGVLVRIPVKWKWSMWDRTATNSNIPLWGQQHQLPLNDSFSTRPGCFYVVWVHAGGSVAGQNRGGSQDTINRLAWAISRLLVQVTSIKIGVF